ncbi:MAG: hypothetical protein ACI83W_001098 [Marinoscillum sp.]|jgi:hypothetical protein
MLSVRGKLLILILLCFSISLSAQRITLKGGFVKDSLKIGEDITFWMSVTYPEEIELTLPDTTFNFEPFEYSSKQYFEGAVLNGLVKDSAIYTLQSFEIDPVQYLSLPAFIINPKRDTTVIEMDLDSIFLQELVAQVSDTTQLKVNVDYQNVRRQFNYPLLWIIIGVLVILTIAGFLIFGKKIQRTFKLRRLRKAYIRFSEKLSNDIHLLRKDPEIALAEKVVSDWKKFLELLEDVPFSKLTTKEIMALEHTAELKDTLKSIDRSVYGKKENAELFKDFQAIEDFTQHRYQLIIDQIKNTK